MRSLTEGNVKGNQVSAADVSSLAVTELGLLLTIVTEVAALKY